jgi:hypothetical protein
MAFAATPIATVGGAQRIAMSSAARAGSRLR